MFVDFEYDDHIENGRYTYVPEDENNGNEYIEFNIEYYGTAEPPVRCGESHLSGLTEPLHFVY